MATAAAIKAYQHIADLSLWLKLNNGDALTMADIPDLISLRWPQFRDKWVFLEERVKSNVSGADNPDFALETINKFTEFVNIQKLTSSQLNPFSDKSVFYKYYDVFNLMPIDMIPVNNNESKIIQERTRTVSNYTKNHFIAMKRDIRTAMDEKADITGASDEDYNSAFNRSSVTQQTSISIDDVKTMRLYQDSERGLDFILSNITTINTVGIDPFALLRANANNPDIPFELYSSGRLVRMGYGEDLKVLAARYLGDEDKWMEIAVANGLRPPFIDEIGTTVPLLSNASGNKINLAATDSNGELNIEKLYIDQLVILQSDVETKPEQRKIVDIYEVPINGEIVVELDGSNDLDRYTTVDDAHIRVYKRNTINSGLYVLIPSQDELPPETNTDVPWFLQASSSDEKQAKVDLLLDADGDLVFDATNDVQLNYGLSNAIQAVKLKMATEAGELPRHPEYGLVTIQGQTNADLASVRQTLIESINFNIENDTRLERVERLDVEYFSSDDSRLQGTAFLVTLEVRLAGGETVIPVSFAVNVL